jgi:hypothetical protein
MERVRSQKPAYSSCSNFHATCTLADTHPYLCSRQDLHSSSGVLTEQVKKENVGLRRVDEIEAAAGLAGVYYRENQEVDAANEAMAGNSRHSGRSCSEAGMLRGKGFG